MTYKALRLYPLRRYQGDGKKEKYELLYVSAHVRERIHGIYADMDRLGIREKDLARYLSYSGQDLRRRACGGEGMSLRSYLKCAQVLGWDLSHDVNYAYAEVLYPPEEILRRWRRIFGSCLSVKSVSQILGCTCTSAPQLLKIRDTITYGKYRTLRVYARLMHRLAWFERLEGYSDALNFEE